MNLNSAVSAQQIQSRIGRAEIQRYLNNKSSTGFTKKGPITITITITITILIPITAASLIECASIVPAVQTVKASNAAAEVNLR